ncbi:hypothetical protein OQA88_9937 [Cercophora sp. LCS_1]
MPTPLRVIIIGGVAGGMSAATRLRRLNESASITVFERGHYVSYANCGIPYALGDVIANREDLLLQTPQSFKERFNIDVRVDDEVVGIDRQQKVVLVKPDGSQQVKEYPYDKVILSQGAAPLVPAIPGAKEEEHVFHLTTVDDLDKAKGWMNTHSVTHAVVVGGGFIGVEAAENLRLLGLEVTVVERMDHVLPPYDADIVEVVHAEMRRNGVRLVTGATVVGIEKECVVLDTGDKVPSQLVLLVMGVRARTDLARQAGLELGERGIKVNDQMQTSDPDIYAVGDMAETVNRVTGQMGVVALAGPANREGRLAADHICGRDVRYPGNIGTSVCKCFDVTVGIAGMSVDGLRRAGMDPLWVSAHPPNHAGYYPGAKQLTLKVAFDKKDGRLLGAQAVGAAGVDKRIDVLSTAIQARMTIFDLENLELAYAPPYGSAKDAVNMVGFIGSNLMRGDTRIAHPEDLSPKRLEGFQVLDVRTPREFARGYLKSAVNIPINSLREKMGELDKSRPTLAYCQVGYRGYLAQRLLEQNGFDVVNLNGGYKSVEEAGLKSLQVVPPQPNGVGHGFLKP